MHNDTTTIDTATIDTATIDTATMAAATNDTATNDTATNDAATDDTAPAEPGHRPDPDRVVTAMRSRSFAMLASVSAAGRPHAAGVLYELVGHHLYVSTLRSSRKARNVAGSGRVGITIPIRRLPIGPPSTVQFQATADVLDNDDPAIAALVADGRLGSITGHGELDLPDGCFLRITLPRRLFTYGLGMSLWNLIRNPLDASGVVELEPA